MTDMTKPSYRLETLALHAGERPDPTTAARTVPIYRTTAYRFRDSAQAAAIFALKEPGHIYARLSNPTNEVLENRLAALSGGAAGLTLASGTAAVHLTVTNILKTGDELVSAANLYGGTYTLFDAILPQENGITVRFTPVNDFEAVEKAVNGRTRAIFVETIGNPGLEVADLEGYARLARRLRLPLVADATFTPPTLLRPIEYGADVVIHSLSKWIGGHGAGIGGAVVDAGRFDWSDPKFDLYHAPDRGYHGFRFGHDLGALQPLAFITRLRLVGLRNLGPTLAPDAAWQFLQGLETLPLRMARHSENALAVAEFLKRQPQVAWVRYPGLPDDPARELARKYLPQGAGGMVVFGVRGGRQAAARLVDNIRLFSLLANVGDAKSLIIHSASTTHSQLSSQAQADGGLSEDLIRLSIGLEHIDDLREALAEALKLI